MISCTLIGWTWQKKGLAQGTSHGRTIIDTEKEKKKNTKKLIGFAFYLNIYSGQIVAVVIIE